MLSTLTQIKHANRGLHAPQDTETRRAVGDTKYRVFDDGSYRLIVPRKGRRARRKAARA